MSNTLEAAPVLFPLAGKRVWVAGSRGMLGSALLRRLAQEKCAILLDRPALDLRRPDKLEEWLNGNQPDAVFVAAATVGGIMANATHPADFLYNNLAIATNIVQAAAKAEVKKLLFLGAACMYPRLAAQPISESALLEGPLEPTNQWFGVAKIAGVKLCEAFRAQHGCDFISAVPATIYGPGDRFDRKTANVIPALLRRAHEARAEKAAEFAVWGTGTPMREFIYVDDCADALVFLMERYSDTGMINVGTGQEVSIQDLAQRVSKVAGFSGKVSFDSSKPDGMPRKLLDSSRILNMGWRPKVSLDDGLTRTYLWWLRKLVGSR